jgi:ABC-type uncharacterized transport system auxiliary subunit
MIRAYLGTMRTGHIERGRRGTGERSRPMVHWKTLSMAALSALLLAGCGSAPRSRYYQLTVPSGAPTVQAPDSKVTLVVGNLSASHLYREEGIVYSLGPEEMGTYQYQLWAEPPTQMIEEVLLRELRTSGRYLGVYPLRSQTSGNFLIHGRLYDFKEVDGGSIVARVSFDMEMRDLKTGATVWTHYYTHDEPVSAKNVPAVVAALDQNVQRGIKEVAASLDQYFASHPVN